jgi:hypothetical protein
VSRSARVSRVEHRFVEFLPEDLEPDTLYISMEYGTSAHSCLCGCGERVVTPLTPTDWHLVYDGETVSLTPSIGNWSFPCQSHYWIERSRAHWSGRWSKQMIEANRADDLEVKERFFAGEPMDDSAEQVKAYAIHPSGLWNRFARILRRRPDAGAPDDSHELDR